MTKKRAAILLVCDIMIPVLVVGSWLAMILGLDGGILGPTIGYPAMFIGSNLYLHLIVPVLAIASLLALQLCRSIPARFAPTGVLPMAAYAVFYYGNILVNGLTSGPAGTDWYGFTMGGTVPLWAAVAVIFVICLIMAFILWFAGGGRRRKGVDSAR